MIYKYILIILTAFGLSIATHGQEMETARPVLIRAVLQDPVHPAAELFYPDKSNAINKLNFRPKDLSRDLLMLPVNGSLVLYDKAAIDPKNPSASLAASAKLPPGLTRAMVVVIPAPTGSTPPYQMIIIDDSLKGFPKGESRVLSLVGVETAIEAGEHKLPIHPGKITRVPPVKKVDNFNMGQTNFYYKNGEKWVPFTQRQLQFIDNCRRLFIIYATPGALQPKVSTIVDTTIGMPQK